MYQQSLDLRDRFSEQLCLNLDVPEIHESTLTYCGKFYLTDSSSSVGTMNSYITVNNFDGDEAARIDDTGLSLKVENKTWLKTKVANWLGVNYL